MKTNPTFRASYSIPSKTSKKPKKEALRKQKVVQAIFKKSQEQTPSKKKLPEGKLSLKTSSGSIKFSDLTKKSSN
jgi:hypothetical protein